MRSRSRCRASSTTRCPSGGELHLASLSQPTLSLSLVPICAQKPWYLHDAPVHIRHPSAIPCFSPYSPISSLSTTVSTSHCSIHFNQTANLSRRTAKFFITTIRHPHASLDGLHTESSIHCLFTQPRHTRAKFFRHVLQLSLHHLRHNPES
jgi:hypothetical protein